MMLRPIGCDGAIAPEALRLVGEDVTSLVVCRRRLSTDGCTADCGSPQGRYGR